MLLKHASDHLLSVVFQFYDCTFKRKNEDNLGNNGRLSSSSITSISEIEISKSTKNK